MDEDLRSQEKQLQNEMLKLKKLVAELEKLQSPLKETIKNAGHDSVARARLESFQQAWNVGFAKHFKKLNASALRLRQVNAAYQEISSEPNTEQDQSAVPAVPTNTIEPPLPHQPRPARPKKSKSERCFI